MISYPYSRLLTQVNIDHPNARVRGWFAGDFAISGLDERTTLKRMPQHRLRALVLEDLSLYPGSSSGDVNRRVGPEVPYRSLKRALDELMEAGKVRHEGQGKGRRYWATVESA